MALGREEVSRSQPISETFAPPAGPPDLQVSPGEIAYSVVRRAIQDPIFLQAFMSNPDIVIHGMGITDSKIIWELKQIIPLIMRSMQQTAEYQAFMAKHAQDLWSKQIEIQKETMDSTKVTIDQFKKGLRETIDQIDVAFRWTMGMYIVFFFLGVGLIVSALAFAVLRGETFLPIVFGGLGISDVIGFFVTKPPHDLQRSRSELAQLQAAYFSWFADIYNWNNFLTFMAQKPGFGYDEMKRISTAVMENTDKTLALIKDYCSSLGSKA